MKVIFTSKLGVSATKETPKDQKKIAIQQYRQNNQLGLEYLLHLGVYKYPNTRQEGYPEEYNSILPYGILNIIGEYLFMEHLEADLYIAHSMYYHIHLKYVIPISIYDNYKIE